MTVKTTRRDGESGEKLLKRFNGHIKSLKLMQKFRRVRYFKPKARKGDMRAAAVVREAHRANNKRRSFL